MEKQKTYRAEDVTEQICLRCGKIFLPVPIHGRENPNRNFCKECLGIDESL